MTGSILLPQNAPSELDKHRRSVRTRTLASRICLAVAVLGILASVVRPLHHILDIVPDLVPGLSPTASVSSILIISILLLLLARGLRLGSRLALICAVVALGANAVLHLLKGLDLFEAAVFAAGAIWLASRHADFPVLPNRRAIRRAIVLTSVVVGLAVAEAVLLLIADDIFGAEHVHEVTRWRHVVNLVLTVVFVVVLFWSLLSPRRPPRLGREDHRRERERARKVVEAWGGGTLDYFALRDDKEWFFVGGSVIAYAVRSGICMVSPDPIGPPAERTEAWADFLENARSYGWSVSIVAASREWLPLYEASGLRTVYLGDEATVDCTTFTMAGSAHKSLRQAVGRVERRGYATTFHDPNALDPELREQITTMSAQSRQGGVERGFSMTLSRMFDPDDTGLMLSVTRNADGRVDAFCQWVPARGINGWSLDVMRRRLDDDDLPNGLIESNIVATIHELADRGMESLGLNFAVMRDVFESEGGSRIDDLARPILHLLSQSTQMESLGTFNEKFDPSWTPRYVILDSAEYVTTQALVLAGAEGVTEIPVIGRFLAPEEHR